MGDPVGINREQVLWRSGDGLAFVVTLDQLLYLCENKSCVAEEVK